MDSACAHAEAEWSHHLHGAWDEVRQTACVIEACRGCEENRTAKEVSFHTTRVVKFPREAVLWQMAILYAEFTRKFVAQDRFAQRLKHLQRKIPFVQVNTFFGALNEHFSFLLYYMHTRRLHSCEQDCGCLGLSSGVQQWRQRGAKLFSNRATVLLVIVRV